MKHAAFQEGRAVVLGLATYHPSHPVSTLFAFANRPYFSKKEKGGDR
jgi:hypothetical protein